METFASSGSLLGKWESSSMEEDDWCCCRGREGFHRPNPQLDRETQLQRTVRLLALACVLLISATLATVVATFVLMGRVRQASLNQPIKHPDIHSAGYAERQLPKARENPRAMLTAANSNLSGGYLQWESELGTAFCHGGFNYSAGSLVVPQDGHYRVFLQITYENTSDEELRLLNRVLYYSDDYPKDKCILSSVETVKCSTDYEQPWSKSLYTSGIFELKANSLLRVTSSNPELIVQNEYKVFFGAEHLPS